LMLAALAGCLALLVSCGEFDTYPEGDLCENAAVDDEGRAIDFPESRICRRKRATRDLDEPDAGRDVDAD